MSLYVDVKLAQEALRTLAEKLNPHHPDKGYLLAEAEFDLAMKVNPDVGDVKQFSRDVIADIFQRAPAASPVKPHRE